MKLRRVWAQALAVLLCSAPAFSQTGTVTGADITTCSHSNAPCGASSIIVPLKREVQLTDAAAGVDFDIRGDGTPIRIAWIADDSAAFLAADRDGDGKITSGKELFGDSTVANKNGFWALLEYMDITRNKEMIPGPLKYIDATNPKWNTLLLWTDLNHNGISEPGELQPVGNVLKSIGTAWNDDGHTDDFGNVYELNGWATYKTPLTPTATSRPPRMAVLSGWEPIWDVLFVPLQ